MPKRVDTRNDDPRMGSVDPALHPPMAFAEEEWAWFSERCAALGVEDVQPKRPALEALYGHLVGVTVWLNLTKLTSQREFLKLHVLDSLSLIGDPRLKHLAEGQPCADLGSGGGYPGLPLALWFPKAPWVLIDARLKKADFLAAAGTIAMKFGCKRVTAAHLRGEDAVQSPHLRRQCQLVVCRAMGQAADVLRAAEPLLHRHGHCIIYKGPAFPGDEEKAAADVAKTLGYRFIAQRTVRLEDSDPERIQVVYERVG